MKKAPSRASKTSSDQAAGHQGKESKTMAEIDQEEGISAEQVVISITEDGYVTSHGDHYHFYNGKVPFDALISQDLIWTDPAYQLNKEDIVHEVEDGYIIKRQDAYYLYLREGSQKVRIRQ
ncbi:pneumococcal-type histidine triad protein [Streptococcus rupicaprae]|uniref:pneumococcal-type histidine triad protein n=1 Tax=Streptococcus rupicaprae TaxID=759619 RepID=UPI0033954F92